MRTPVKCQPKPISALHVRRQEILSELVRVNHQIAHVEKEMTHLKERMLAFVPPKQEAA